MDAHELVRAAVAAVAAGSVCGRDLLRRLRAGLEEASEGLPPAPVVCSRSVCPGRHVGGDDLLEFSPGFVRFVAERLGRDRVDADRGTVPGETDRVALARLVLDWAREICSESPRLLLEAQAAESAAVEAAVEAIAPFGGTVYLPGPGPDEGDAVPVDEFWRSRHDGARLGSREVWEAAAAAASPGSWEVALERTGGRERRRTWHTTPSPEDVVAGLPEDVLTAAAADARERVDSSEDRALARVGALAASGLGERLVVRWIPALCAYDIRTDEAGAEVVGSRSVA